MSHLTAAMRAHGIPVKDATVTWKDGDSCLTVEHQGRTLHVAFSNAAEAQASLEQHHTKHRGAGTGKPSDLSYGGPSTARDQVHQQHNPSFDVS